MLENLTGKKQKKKNNLKIKTKTHVFVPFQVNRTPTLLSHKFPPHSQQHQHFFFTLTPLPKTRSWCCHASRWTSTPRSAWSARCGLSSRARGRQSALRLNPHSLKSTPRIWCCAARCVLRCVVCVLERLCDHMVCVAVFGFVFSKKK